MLLQTVISHEWKESLICLTQSTRPLSTVNVSLHKLHISQLVSVFRLHVTKTASIALDPAMELHPVWTAGTVHQLFAAAVTPVVDYAANFRMHTNKDRMRGLSEPYWLGATDDAFGHFALLGRFSLHFCHLGA